MTIEQNVETVTQDAGREAWIKPEIASFEPITATEANTLNPGDGLSSNS